MKPISELQAWVLVELIVQYDLYLTEFYDDCLDEDGSRPININAFYANDFLGYAEEKGFAHLLSENELKYSYRKVSKQEVKVTVSGFVMGITLPPSLVNADWVELRKYIEKYYGDTILKIMKEKQL